MQITEIMKQLKAHSNPGDIEFMAKYGIKPDKTFGTKMPVLRQLAKEIGHDHSLAQKLWAKGYRETMILASLVEDPGQVTEEQMEEWAAKFDYWEICDQCVINLFSRTEFAKKKALEWSSHPHEGTKRAAFVLMARLAVSEKKKSNEFFLEFLPIIKRESIDDRNDVKKAVNWALRQIGKFNPDLNKKAIETGQEIQKLDSKAARWVASDALRELTSEKIQERLKKNN